MPSDLILLTGGGACLVLVVYAGLQLLPQQSQGAKKERRLLAEMAWLWTGKGDVLEFRDIARIWRITPEVRNEPSPPPEYTREEIRQFHSRWVTLPTVKGEKKQIIENILSLLDHKGDCPSVVQRNKNEAENKYDKDVFEQLAQVPLWKHSLTVASHLAESMKQAVMIPDALLAGLGHDLGKVPAYQDTLYRTGDHPILSLIVLNRIPGYESMSNTDDVSQAVRQHHQLAPETPLGVALKKADKKARLEEISRMSLVEKDIPLGKAEKPEEDLPPSPNIKETGEGKPEKESLRRKIIDLAQSEKGSNRSRPHKRANLPNLIRRTSRSRQRQHGGQRASQRMVQSPVQTEGRLQILIWLSSSMLSKRGSTRSKRVAGRSSQPRKALSSASRTHSGKRSGISVRTTRNCWSEMLMKGQNGKSSGRLSNG